MQGVHVLQTTAISWGIRHQLPGVLRATGGIGQSGQAEGHGNAGIHCKEQGSAKQGIDSCPCKGAGR